MSVGQFEEAESALQEALTKAPSDPDSLANLIVVSYHLQRPENVINRYLRYYIQEDCMSYIVHCCTCSSSMHRFRVYNNYHSLFPCHYVIIVLCLQSAEEQVSQPWPRDGHLHLRGCLRQSRHQPCRHYRLIMTSLSSNYCYVCEDSVSPYVTLKCKK